MGTISPDSRSEDRAPENGRTESTVNATTPKTRNLYNKMEWAGAFGDIGTLIPFVVAYITIVKVEPLGLLLMFGIALMASGLYYRTPLPIQPMKAIGAAAIAGGIRARRRCLDRASPQDFSGFWQALPGLSGRSPDLQPSRWCAESCWGWGSPSWWMGSTA